MIRADSLREARDVAGLETLKADAVAQYRDNPLLPHLPGILTTVGDMWIAFVQGEYQQVVDLYSELPEQIDGDVPGWIMIRSLLELGLAERAVQMVEEMAALGPLDGVSRIDPLPWRQGEYFMARSYEAIGDTASAIEVYEDLVVGFGDAVARNSLMADAPARLEALRAGGGSAEAVPTDEPGGSNGGSDTGSNGGPDGERGSSN
jgi:hypothetical protein